MTALAQLEAALCQAAPHHRSRIRHQLALMDAGLRQFLETYVAHCTQAGASCDDMAESYAFLLRETMKEQMYFAKHGTYRYHTQDDVRDRVYRDDGYMTKYMTGLALSTVLWPNHVALYHFFKRFVESDKCPRGGVHGSRGRPRLVLRAGTAVGAVPKLHGRGRQRILHPPEQGDAARCCQGRPRDIPLHGFPGFRGGQL